MFFTSKNMQFDTKNYNKNLKSHDLKKDKS